MWRVRRGTILDRLSPEVRGHVSARLDLCGELVKLEKVLRVQAPEAVVFYCARVLEALAADGLEEVGLRPSTNVCANLDVLSHYGLLVSSPRCWAHSLRRVGNEARHVRRPLAARDAELALLYTERWLCWFFGPFRDRREDRLTRDGRAPFKGVEGRLRGLMESLDRDEIDPGALGRDEAADLPASVASAVVEMLLARDSAPARAQEVADAALDRHPDDLRLAQLRALCLSRQGELARAISILEPLKRRHPEDDETTGILAGAYKKLWMADESRRELLEKARAAYRSGWVRSRLTNAYLGINAATTSLWAGRAEEAREIAGQVSERLGSREARLKPRVREAAGPGTYWDRVTLAEAELVLGRLEEARRSYRSALALDRGGSDGKVTREQAERLLRSFGLQCRFDEFLDGAD